MDRYQVIGDGIVEVGQYVSIGDNVKFVLSSGVKVSIGDFVTLGDGVKFVVESGAVNIGDWSTIHAGCLLLSTLGLDIGQHCWFGQNTVLDGTGSLIIKNGVRVGMNSQIWSHVAAGEQIEGCTLFGAKPVHIEEDVWLVGSCTVGSGVRLGRRAICMNGSNVTKNVQEGTVVAGTPAKVRPRLSFYREISLDEKFKLLIGWLHEFASDNIDVMVNSLSSAEAVVRTKLEVAYFCKYKTDYEGKSLLTNESKFEIETKKYAKTFISLEKRVIKFLSGNKARFYY